MSVAIRFSRQGKKKSPFYRIVAADKRCARDGRFIELLGTYHPTTKVLKLDAERYEKWLKVGAQPQRHARRGDPSYRPQRGEGRLTPMSDDDDRDDRDDRSPTAAGTRPSRPTSPS